MENYLNDRRVTDDLIWEEPVSVECSLTSHQRLFPGLSAGLRVTPARTQTNPVEAFLRGLLYGLGKLLHFFFELIINGGKLLFESKRPLLFQRLNIGQSNDG